MDPPVRCSTILAGPFGRYKSGAVGKNSVERCEGGPADPLPGIVLRRVGGETGCSQRNAGTDGRNSRGQLVD